MNSAENDLSIFERGERASEDYFTGNAWVKFLVPKSEIFNCQIANVEFEAGARTNWHTHGGGQILIITTGSGYYQEKGKPAQKLEKGSVVQIPPDLEHWHGASAEKGLSHIAVNTNAHLGVATWLEKVTDEEYRSAK